MGNLRISASSTAGGPPLPPSHLTRVHAAVSQLSKQLCLFYSSDPGCLFVTDDAVKSVTACQCAGSLSQT